jgi:MoxR-like ATPase
MKGSPMTVNKPYQFYTGTGQTITERGSELPPPEKGFGDNDPARYIAADSLRDAVNVALMLGQPLLVTGEPGTGKTQLAWSIAYELRLNGPLVFHTKTTSTAKDLFYRYDALRHFHDANIRSEQKELATEKYITYEALGLAILLSHPPHPSLPLPPSDPPCECPVRSVVLIDEVDKASRDFPNDILYEIEEMTFTVSETGRTFKINDNYRPFVLITSNSEKNLPDAFLRRCVFYDIPFPSKDQLTVIVQSRLGLSDEFRANMLENAIELFQEIRDLALRKKPATAELLAWIKVLDRMQINVRHLGRGQAEALALTYSIIAKNKDDLETIKYAYLK